MPTTRGGLQTEAEQQTASSQISRHLLIIGIDEYPSAQINALYNAVQDAKKFGEVLRGKYGYQPENITTLYNGEATYDAIDAALRNVMSTATKADDVVLYFAGHGHYDKQTNAGYWLPSDAQGGQLKTYFPNRLILDRIKSSNARHVFGVVDSCFSGSLFVERSLSATAQRLYSLPSRWLMTSGLVEPVSDGLSGQHSPFAKALLTALESDASTALGVTQLWQLMRDGVIANARQTPRCEPLQQANHMGGEMYFLNPEQPVPKRILQLPEETPVYTDSKGNEFMLEIEELEQQGKLRLTKLLLHKLQHMQEALLLATDANVQFKYEMQIEQMQKQLEGLKD